MDLLGLTAYEVLVLSWIGLPIFIAFRRSHRHRWLIVAIAVLTSWTLIGWIVAMLWARHAPTNIAVS